MRPTVLRLTGPQPTVPLGALALQSRSVRIELHSTIHAELQSALNEILCCDAKREKQGAAAKKLHANEQLAVAAAATRRGAMRREGDCEGDEGEWRAAS